MKTLPRIFLIAGFLSASGCVTTPSSESDVQAQGMDKEEIRKVIREHIVPIRHCYEKELKANPKLEGRLVLEWDVVELGKVKEVRVRKSVSPSIDGCVSGVIKGTLFPTPPKNQIGRIVYPFEFSKTPVN